MSDNTEFKSPDQLAEEATQALNEVLGKTEALKPKERMAITCQDMPTQDPNVRNGNMEEVAVGYTADQARLESMRCLSLFSE